MMELKVGVTGKGVRLSLESTRVLDEDILLPVLMYWTDIVWNKKYRFLLLEELIRNRHIKKMCNVSKKINDLSIIKWIDDEEMINGSMLSLYIESKVLGIYQMGD